MCEVGSCCGCISLYRGCLLIGLVTIFVSATQMTVFTLILIESYDSSTSKVPMNHSLEEDEAFYSFKSPLCPFGFIPLAKTVLNEPVKPPRNETAKFLRNAHLYELSHPTLSTMAIPTAPTKAVPTALTMAIPTSSTNENESLLERRNTSNTFNISTKPEVTFERNVPIETTKKISCLAPTQGVLWALVIASGLYAPVGVVLIIGVREGMTCFLSTWFFYTVGYNLLALIVALTDGVYTGAADVSSYLVTLVTAYCIIVVDSYYEKLLKNERVETASKNGPSLVVVKSTPNSVEGSPQGPPLYAMPTRRQLSAPPGYAAPGYAAPGEASELLLPASPYLGRDTFTA